MPVAGGPPQLPRSPRAAARPPSSHRTRHRFVAIVGLLTTLAIPAAAQRAVAPPPTPWLGCYQLATSPWSPATVDSTYALPPTLRLDSLPASAPPTRRGRWYAVEGAMPSFAARRSLLAVVGWRPSSGDSVTVVWGDGFVRLTARLAMRGDSIAGTLTWHRVTPRLDAAGRPIRDLDARATLAGARVGCG